MFTTTDLEWMAEQSGGVRITLSGKRTWGHFDITDELVQEIAVQAGAKYMLRYPTGKLTGLALGSSVKIDGAEATRRDITGTYEVRHGPMRLEDGEVSMILLADA